MVADDVLELPLLLFVVTVVDTLRIEEQDISNSSSVSSATSEEFTLRFRGCIEKYRLRSG